MLTAISCLTRGVDKLIVVHCYPPAVISIECLEDLSAAFEKENHGNKIAELQLSLSLRIEDIHHPHKCRLVQLEPCRNRNAMKKWEGVEYPIE